MSYVLTGFGSISTSASASASLSMPGKGGAQANANANAKATTSTPAAPAKPAVPLTIPDCRDAAITKGDYKLIDDVFVDCCEKIKQGGGSVTNKLKGIGECAAKNTARGVGGAIGAAAAAAVCTATGVGAVVAPFCAMAGGALGTVVGGFIYERVVGYDTAQIVGGLVAGAVCTAVTGVGGPLCALIAAELIGWLTDGVGPVIEGIFDPGAAARRERAARDAYHKAIEANEQACKDADDKYRLAWGLGVGSLKELYNKAFRTSALQAQAKKLLGFGATYDEIARAMQSGGAAAEIWAGAAENKTKRGCYSGHPDWQCPGCEQFEYVKNKKLADPQWDGTPWEGITSAWVVTQTKDPWSDLCPFSVYRFYLSERAKLGPNPKRDAVTKWEKSFSATIAEVAAQIYPAMVQAIAAVAAQIAAVAIALKQQELITSAQNADKSALAARVLIAAASAEGAAKTAKTGSSKQAQTAIKKAAYQADIASAAYQKLMADYYGGKPTSSGAAASQAMACQQEAVCKRASGALLRALQAKKNAPIFAAETARNRMLLGGAVALGAAGAAYYFTR